MRFPSRLLAANVWFALAVAAGFVTVVTAITTGVAIFGTISRSAWELAAQLPRWYVLFVGVALVWEFLPLYVAHGQTRRQFGAQAAVTAVLFAPFMAGLLVLGYLLEALVYRLANLPQVLDRAHLFSEPTQVPLVFVEYLVEFLAWIVAGAFIGAGFYRWRSSGVFTIPVGIGLVVLGEAATGTELQLPFIDIGLNPPSSLGVTLGLGLATFLLGLALTWLIIRDVPLRNRPA
jgi:hypothetical protein